MTGLADADIFEICIEDCLLAGFQSLFNRGIELNTHHLVFIIFFVIDILLANFTENIGRFPLNTTSKNYFLVFRY